MYQRPVLGLAEAQTALDAMLEEASKEPDRPVGIAIVDHEGDLICYVRMDRTGTNARRASIRKAYTSGRVGADTRVFREQLKVNGSRPGDLDPTFLGSPGGICLLKDGFVLGGIGVSGRLAEEDEDIARVGVAALRL
jgi:glc operon protein GlcG